MTVKLNILKECEVPITVQHPDRGDVELIQVFDAIGMQAMLNSFLADAAQPGFEGMLIDFDHFSEEGDHSSEAAGWAHKIELADGRLNVVDPELSDLGEAAIAKKRFKFASISINPKDCQYLGNNRVRPMRFERIAMTNDPRVRGLSAHIGEFRNRAFLNRAEHGDFAGAQPAGAPGATGADGGIRMKTVLKELGLAENAEESAVLSAVHALRNRAGSADTATASLSQVTQERDTLKTENQTLKNRVTQLEDADLDQKVEADLETHKGKFANRDEMKALLRNRQTRDATLKALALVPAGSRLLNRDTAKTPSGGSSSETQDADRDQFIDHVQRTHNLKNRSDAHSLARTLKPELFK